MESDIRVKFVEGIPWPDNSWQMELATRGLGPHNKEWHDREVADRKLARETALQEILAALQDESYDVVELEEGSYSDYHRTVLTRKPIKTLKIDLNRLHEEYGLDRWEGDTFEDEMKNDYHHLWKAVNAAFRYDLGESDENDGGTDDRMGGGDY